MTTLQELLDRYWSRNSTVGETADLIKAAYLAGKEDERKRVVEIIEEQIKETPDLNDPYYKTGGIFQKEQERQLAHMVDSIRGYNSALSDLKQSIIK